MEIEMKKPLEIEDGVHTGAISRIEYRDTPYRYTDIFIKPEGLDAELKLGAPSNLSPNTKLGKLLLKFREIPFGEMVDPEKVLVGKKVQFQTLNEKTEKGVFARVVDNSVKPVE